VCCVNGVSVLICVLIEFYVIYINICVLRQLREGGNIGSSRRKFQLKKYQTLNAALRGGLHHLFD